MDTYRRGGPWLACAYLKKTNIVKTPTVPGNAAVHQNTGLVLEPLGVIYMLGSQIGPKPACRIRTLVYWSVVSWCLATRHQDSEVLSHLLFGGCTFSSCSDTFLLESLYNFWVVPSIHCHSKLNIFWFRGSWPRSFQC